MGAQLRILRDWPASMTADESVEYTGLSATEILRAERDGRLNFKPLGRNGAKVVLRTQLDALLDFLWNDRAGTPLEDMDFGESDN